MMVSKKAKSNPESHVKEFLIEQMNGPEIYQKYATWCESKHIQQVKLPTFFLFLFQFFGAIKT